MKVIYFSDYLEQYGNASLAMLNAVKAFGEDGGKLVLAPESYDFTPDDAYERFYYISNNDCGNKRIAMPLIGLKHITVEGNGAQLRLSGKILPIVIDQSEDILVKDLSIDYDRTFCTEALIEKAGRHEVVLKIDAEKYPYYVRCGQLRFTGRRWDTGLITNILQYSPETGNIEPGTADFFLSKFGYYAEEAPEGRVKLRFLDRDYPYNIREGNVFVLSPSTRENPGVFVTDSGDVRMENVTVNHCEGMAFIFQLCRGVELDSCRVEPSEGRFISACADATHFVNCTGDITICNCVFKNQCDDATNVHGIYTKIEKICGDRLYLKFMHFQQEGVPLYHEGDELLVVERRNMTGKGRCRVRSVEAVNGQTVCVVVDKLPEGVAEDDSVENMTRVPSNVTITGCKTGGNRARAFLISCRGRVRICENDIKTLGAAVLISGDCNFWYESGPSEDVVISNNRIDCRGRMEAWGHAPVDIVPVIEQAETVYHGRVEVSNNEIYDDDGAVINAHNVRNLTVENNVVYRDGEERTVCKPVSAAIEACAAVGK